MSQKRRPDPALMARMQNQLRSKHRPPTQRDMKKQAAGAAAFWPTLEPPSLVMDKPVIEQVIANGVGYSEYNWTNSTYHGVVRRYSSGFPWGGGPFAVVSLTANDQTSRHDWREFQQLKTLILGPDWEAMELYPAEDRLVDQANRFYLWCVPSGVINFGLSGEHRDVRDMKPGDIPQRPFPAFPPDVPASGLLDAVPKAAEREFTVHTAGGWVFGITPTNQWVFTEDGESAAKFDLVAWNRAWARGRPYLANYKMFAVDGDATMIEMLAPEPEAADEPPAPGPGYVLKNQAGRYLFIPKPGQAEETDDIAAASNFLTESWAEHARSRYGEHWHVEPCPYPPTVTASLPTQQAKEPTFDESLAAVKATLMSPSFVVFDLKANLYIANPMPDGRHEYINALMLPHEQRDCAQRFTSPTWEPYFADKARYRLEYLTPIGPSYDPSLVPPEKQEGPAVVVYDRKIHKYLCDVTPLGHVLGHTDDIDLARRFCGDGWLAHFKALGDRYAVEEIIDDTTP